MRKGKKSNGSDHMAAVTQEITMNAKIKSTAIAVALAGLFAAQPAAADTLTFGGFANGSVGATIYSPLLPSTGRGVSAGGFNMINTTPSPDVSFQAWCVDIFGTLASTIYNNVSGGTFYPTGNRAANLEALATRYLPSVPSNPTNVTGNATNSAAFQLAVWEIVNETSGVYSLSGGNFHATSSNAVINAAANMLAGLNSTTTNTAQILRVWQEVPGHPTQDLAVFAPVPEPQTYAMMLAGLGLMGFVARRRKQEQDYA